jgi:hypothetical protein
MQHFEKDGVLSAMAGRFADFYQTYSPLKPEGQKMRGPCPVHGGNGPNFALDPFTGLWFCHSRGCGKPGGDIFDFVMAVEGVTFPEALEHVANYASVAPDASASFRSVPGHAFIKSAPTMYEDHFLDVTLAEGLHQRLMENPKVTTWLLKHRGWTTETLVRFQIGFLPPAITGEEARICFPIYDQQKRLINIRKHLFAYRPDLTDARRRELNKTLPWGKGLGTDLYPLTALENKRDVLLVEGEADATLACQLGFAAITGTLGAETFKPHWAETLRGRVVAILYDGDEAGRKGTSKAVAALLGVAAQVRVAHYPVGINDLSEWVVEHGAQPEDIQAVMDAAEPIEAAPENTQPETRDKQPAKPLLNASVELIPCPTNIWPTVDPAMFHGLLGEIVQAVGPHTEADPVAVALSLLVGFGIAVGRNAYCQVGTAKHYGNLYGVLCGDTNSAKGTSWNLASTLLRGADAVWHGTRITGGMSSGEGLIGAVRDPTVKKEPIRDKKQIVDYQDVITDEGVADKRLLVVETEFSRTLKVCERENSTLSAVMRQGWDGDNLQVMTKENQSATGAHIGILGHITPIELKRDLTQTNAANGFGNRFLWLCVRRSKLLPEGGELHTVDMNGFIQRLAESLEFGRQAGEIKRDDDARLVWQTVYPELTAVSPGLLGCMTARAAPITLRLSMLYALLDRSETIRRDHLMAALSLWEYAKDSVRYLFGDALGDTIADVILRGLRETDEGKTRSEIAKMFDRNLSSGRITQALALLQSLDHARGEKQPTGGRAVERWFAT